LDEDSGNYETIEEITGGRKTQVVTRIFIVISYTEIEGRNVIQNMDTRFRSHTDVKTCNFTNVINEL